MRAFNYIDTICARYLMRSTWVFLGVIFIVIGLIIFGNQFVLVVKDSLKQGIPMADVLPLIALKMLRDIPFILSLSLFLGIVAAINSLYKNSEAVVMNSLGLGDKHFMVFISPIVVGIFVFILFLTVIATPWAAQQKNIITQRYQNTSDSLLIKPGEFQTFKNGNIVFYASEVKTDKTSKQRIMYDVFIYNLVDNKPVITLAKSAQRYTNPATNSTYLRLKEGKRYQGFYADTDKEILNFGEYYLPLSEDSTAETTLSNPNIKAKNTLDLLKANSLSAAAELQWRLSQPLSVLILSILGVLIGKTAPRSGKNLNILFAVIVFILYSNALLIAKFAFEKGDTPQFLGMWWVNLLMFLLVLIFYAYRHKKFSAYYLRLHNAYVSRVK